MQYLLNQQEYDELKGQNLEEKYQGQIGQRIDELRKKAFTVIYEKLSKHPRLNYRDTESLMQDLYATLQNISI